MRGFAVLYEDNQILAVNKSPGWATMGLPRGEVTLLSQLKEWIKERDSKPGEVYLGVVSRLDTPVSGAVLLGKTSKAAARLNEQFRTRGVTKTYWAVVEGHLYPLQGRLHHWLRIDKRFHRVHRTHAKDPFGQEAVLDYRVLAQAAGLTWLEIQPQTGRKHQIRAQLGVIGHPIMGDAKYGAKRPFTEGIALHARQVTFVHPASQQEMTVVAPLPSSWRGLPFRLPIAETTPGDAV